VCRVSPLLVVCFQHSKQEDRRQKTMLAGVYGTHAPMRLEMEQAILSQFRRLPGLKSHHVGLETLMGRDEEIDFGDYMGSTFWLFAYRFCFLHICGSTCIICASAGSGWSWSWSCVRCVCFHCHCLCSLLTRHWPFHF